MLVTLPLMQQNRELLGGDLSMYPPYQPLQLKHYPPPFPGVAEGEQPEDEE